MKHLTGVVYINLSPVLGTYDHFSIKIYLKIIFISIYLSQTLSMSLSKI